MDYDGNIYLVDYGKLNISFNDKALLYIKEKELLSFTLSITLLAIATIQKLYYFFSKNNIRIYRGCNFSISKWICFVFY